MRKSIIQPINQHISPSINQSIHQYMLSINQSVHQSIIQSTYQPVHPSRAEIQLYITVQWHTGAHSFRILTTNSFEWYPQYIVFGYLPTHRASSCTQKPIRQRPFHTWVDTSTLSSVPQQAGHSLSLRPLFEYATTPSNFLLNTSSIWLLILKYCYPFHYYGTAKTTYTCTGNARLLFS